MLLKDIKVIFMGTPEFSLPVLEDLINKTNVIGVVTQPDRYVGKNKEKSISPVKKMALDHNIKVFQPERIRKDYQEILICNPDVIITCAYGQIIPEAIINYPKYGCLNVHGSLLPKLRGASPIHHAIIDGYNKTGITIMYMDKGMDTGDIISQKEIIINDTDTVGTLHDKLSVLGRDLLMETLPSIINGTNARIKQDEREVTYCYPIKHEEELINFNQTCLEIYNKVRGMNPYPVSYFLLDNHVVKTYEVSYEKCNDYQEKNNGEIVIITKNSLGIKVLDGIIYLKDLKKEGHKRMKISDFLNGEKGTLLGKIVNKGE